jgi:hypothetical protein
MRNVVGDFATFLQRLKTLLDDLNEKYRFALPGRFLESMDAAWVEVKPKFQEADVALQSDTTLDDLKAHGLIGPQLIFKLKIFEHARDELADHSNQPSQQDDRWWNRWRGRFRYALKSADVILGSLAKVLLVLEPVKEFKEAIETALPLEPDENK